VAIALALGPGQAPRLTVALEPEELGRVEIRIERGAEGNAVQVLAERPETLALLQRDARELDRALQGAGLAVGDGGLRFGLSGEERPHGGRAPPGSGGGGRPRRGGPAPADGIPGAVGARPPAASLSLLDIAV
jgi:Meckel syndrome type 1 protein